MLKPNFDKQSSLEVYTPFKRDNTPKINENIMNKKKKQGQAAYNETS